MQGAFGDCAFLLFRSLAHTCEPISRLAAVHIELEYAEVEYLVAPKREEQGLHIDHRHQFDEVVKYRVTLVSYQVYPTHDHILRKGCE